MKSSTNTTSDISQTLKIARRKVFDLLVDNVSRPHDLYKASDHFLRDKTPFVQVAAADESLRAAWRRVPRWLLPRIPGGGKHPGIRFVKNIMDDLAQLGQLGKRGEAESHC
jgi:hypothetical protein